MKITVYIIILGISLVCFSMVLVPPDLFWISGFLAYMIPFVLALNIFLLIRSLVRLKLSFVFPLTVLIIGWGFINDTYQFPVNHEDGPITIMSYNTRVFNVYDPGTTTNGSHKKMTEWISSTGADLICLQEFYNDPGSKQFNIISQINHNKDYQVYNLPVYVNKSGAQFGIAIFSKFPIIRKGEIPFKGATQNQVIYADILIGTDTVRIYNLHLQSMHIDENDVTDYREDWEEDARDLISRLKSGFVFRASQIRQVKKDIISCPYPVIVCGDLNDMPYSYSYYQLKRIMENGFTAVGRGFGFTFNGKLSFLRIDHQYFSKGLKIHTLKANKSIKYSDHFPLIGTYSLVKN